MFQHFVKLKYCLKQPSRDVDIRGFERVATSVVANKFWKYNQGVLGFGILDLHEAPKQKAGKSSTFGTPLQPFLNHLATHLDPNLNTPNVWF